MSQERPIIVTLRLTAREKRALLAAVKRSRTLGGLSGFVREAGLAEARRLRMNGRGASESSQGAPQSRDVRPGAQQEAVKEPPPVLLR